MNTSDHLIKLCEKIGDTPLIMAGNELVQQSGDQSVVFCQEASFFWTTGIEEPGWRLIVDKKDTWLVSPTRSEIQEIFDGQGRRYQRAAGRLRLEYGVLRGWGPARGRQHADRQCRLV